MVRCAIIPPAQLLFCPDRRKDKHIVANCLKAARTIPKYDLISVMQSRQQVTERQAKPNYEYETHRLTSQGVQFFVVPGSIPDGPGDM